MSSTEKHHAALEIKGKDTKKVANIQTSSLPFYIIQGNLQNIITEVSEVYQCSSDYAVSSMYAAVSTMIGKRLWCHADPYKNYGTLWQVIVGYSGKGKTEPLKWFFEPVEQMEEESFQTYCKERDRWNRTPDANRGEQPVFRHCLLGNASDESVLRELYYNGHLTWKVDEMVTMLQGWGRYSKSSDGIVSHLLSIFNYDDVCVTRISSEPLRLTEPNMCIVGGIQPGMFKRYFKGAWIDNGLFQRFLFVWPPRRPTPPMNGQRMSEETRSTWQRWCDHLLRLPAMELPEDDEAKAMRIAAADQWNTEADAVEEDEPNFAALIRKLHVHLCRWAIVAAVLAGKKAVDKWVMGYALDCMQYFRVTGEKAFRFIAGTEQRKEKPLTLAELLQQINDLHPIENISKFSESLRVSRQLVSRILNQGHKNDIEPE